jgi:hypothetical protein
VNWGLTEGKDIVKRTCKDCKVEKEFNYLCLNTQDRSTYKDQDNKLWHGRSCGACHLEYVKVVADKPKLTKVICPACSKEFLQKNGVMRFCGKACRLKRVL